MPRPTKPLNDPRRTCTPCKSDVPIQVKMGHYKRRPGSQTSRKEKEHAKEKKWDSKAAPKDYAVLNKFTRQSRHLMTDPRRPRCIKDSMTVGVLGRVSFPQVARNGLLAGLGIGYIRSFNFQVKGSGFLSNRILPTKHLTCYFLYFTNYQNSYC